MYVAESAKYDSYFPIVQNMLDYFEITNKGHRYYFILQSLFNFNHFTL